MTEPASPIEPLAQGILHFPDGLPGFENLKQFVLLRDEELSPIFFLTSIEEKHICLTVIPVGSVQKDYALRLSEEDRRVLALEPQASLERGIAILAIVNLGDGTQPATANLLAPLVVNLGNWNAKQVIQYDSQYPVALEV